MKLGPDISLVASLVGDPARANMLTALMRGQALTATELAQEAGVTPQTASSHLAKLAAGGLDPGAGGRGRRDGLAHDPHGTSAQVGSRNDGTRQNKKDQLSLALDED